MKNKIITRVLSVILGFSMVTGDILPTFAMEAEQGQVEETEDPEVDGTTSDNSVSDNSGSEEAESVSDDDPNNAEEDEIPEDPFDSEGYVVDSIPSDYDENVAVDYQVEFIERTAEENGYIGRNEEVVPIAVPDGVSYRDILNDEVYESNGIVSIQGDNFYQQSVASALYSEQRTMGAEVKIPSAYPYSADDTKSLKNYLSETYPPCRNQGSYGSCWAHSAVGLAEFYAVKHGLSDLGTETDYSEVHTAWFSKNWVPINDRADATGEKIIWDSDKYDDEHSLGGGRISYVISPWMNGEGVALESDGKYEKAIVALSRYHADPEYWANKSAIRLRSCRLLDIEENPELCKEVIMENGAISISYGTSGVYSGTYNSFFPNDGATINHAVMIVGWDDNYPKEYFAPNKQGTTPQKDGAWLIRNSWNEFSRTLDKREYFWLSYDSPAVYGYSYAYEFEGAWADPGYRYTYQPGTSDYALEYTSEVVDCRNAANVFLANGDNLYEMLKTVQFEILTPSGYEIEVYTEVDPEKGPTSGNRHEVNTRGKIYTRGRYTIDLQSPVIIRKGTYFSVIVKTDSNNSVAMESWETYVERSTLPRQSFMSENGTDWTDMCGAEVCYCKDGDRRWYIEGTNFSITAFTFDLDYELEKTQNPYAVYAGEGDTVSKVGDSFELKCDDPDAEIFYAVTPSNAQTPTYSEVHTRYTGPITVGPEWMDRHYFVWFYALGHEKNYSDMMVFGAADTIRGFASISFAKDKIVLTNGHKTELAECTLYGGDGLKVETPEFKYLSSDENVFTVDENGYVTAVGTGTATLTVSTYLRHGDYSKPMTTTCTVEVDLEHPELERNLTTDVTELTFLSKAPKTIKAEVRDGYGNPVDDTPVYFFSENEEVVKADMQTGVITPVENGSTRVTVSTTEASVFVDVTVDIQKEIYTVDFMTDGNLYYQTKVVEETPITDIPADPPAKTLKGKTLAFLGWKETGAETYWDFSTAVTGNLVLNAEYESPMAARSPFDPDPDLELEDLPLVKGQTFQLPHSAWITSDKSVASLNTRSVVTAKKVGKATISGAGRVFHVTVIVPTFEQSSVTMLAGETKDLVLNLRYGSDDMTYDYPVYWSSSSPAIATVDNGTVTALSKGTATITATVNGKTYNCKVKVNDRTAAKVTKNTDSITLAPMQELTLKLSGYNFKKQNWESTNGMKAIQNGKNTDYADNVVYITSAGKLIAIGAGTTTLSCSNGVELTVTVSEPIAESLYVLSGKSATIKHTGVNAKKASWSTGDIPKDVMVTVNNTGKVTTNGAGVANVTCEYNPYNIEGAGFVYTTTVYVEKPRLASAQGLSLKSDYSYTATMKPGDEIELLFEEGHGYGVFQEITYKSSKGMVAFVDENGILHARSKGKTKLTAKINGKTITINVTVQ